MVIRFEFGAADLAGLRFAHSPMAELVASLFARRSASFRYASWRRGVSLDDVPLLRAVVDGPHGYAPDFLTPVPRVPQPALSDELRAIADTDPDTAVEQVLPAGEGMPNHPRSSGSRAGPARRSPRWPSSSAATSTTPWHRSGRVCACWPTRRSPRARGPLPNTNHNGPTRSPP